MMTDHISRQRLRRLGFVAFLAWAILSVDALLPQLQVLLLGGRVPIHVIAVKALLIGVIILALPLRSKFPTSRGILGSWCIFLFYLGIHAMVLINEAGYNVNYMIFSYNVYYFYILLIPMIFALTGTLPERTVRKCLIALFVPLAILGVAQFLFQSPLIPTESADGYFKVVAWNWFGQVRAFSLFSTGSVFGHFIALVIPLALTNWSDRPRRIWSMVLFVLALGAGYATLTRITYLEILATIAATWAVRKRTKLLLILPVLYGLLAFGVLQAGPQVAASYGAPGNLFSSESLRMRLDSWSIWSERWLHSTPATLWFGTGHIQNDQYKFNEDVVIDNVFYAQGVHVGVAGLVLWALLMWSVWCHVHRVAVHQRTPLSTAIAAFWSTFPLTGLYGSTSTMYALAAMLLIISHPASVEVHAPMLPADFSPAEVR